MNEITSIDDLVKTSDVVAVVTVAGDDIKSDPVGESESEERRYLTLTVDEVIAGIELPTSITLFESLTVSRNGIRSGGRDWHIKVGDRLAVALAVQSSGTYEFNGGLAFFPVADSESADAVANGRIRSGDPAAQAIGYATRDLSDDELTALLRAKATTG